MSYKPLVRISPNLQHRRSWRQRRTGWILRSKGQRSRSQIKVTARPNVVIYRTSNVKRQDHRINKGEGVIEDHLVFFRLKTLFSSSCLCGWLRAPDALWVYNSTQLELSRALWIGLKTAPSLSAVGPCGAVLISQPHRQVWHRLSAGTSHARLFAGVGCTSSLSVGRQNDDRQCRRCRPDNDG